MIEKNLFGYEKYMKNTKTTNKELFYTIKIISEAILNKKNIQFKYYKYNVKKELEFRKAFALFPVTIICDIGQYYLIGADKEKQLFYFRLDRIKNISIAEGKQVNITKKQLNNYIESTIGMYGGEKKTVKAIVNRRLMDDVIDQFGKEVEILSFDDENFTMQTEVNLTGFKNWALRHLEDVKVMYPNELKKEIIEILNASLKQYE